MRAQHAVAQAVKVPIHMPRVSIGSMRRERASISRAALLVKVTARMPRATPGRLDQPGDARGQHARLAAAGAGQNQCRFVRQRHGGVLFGIQVSEEFGHLKWKGCHAALCGLPDIISPVGVCAAGRVGAGRITGARGAPGSGTAPPALTGGHHKG